MNEINDIYKEPEGASESLFKDKGSKHFGYVFPVHSLDDINKRLAELKKKHYSARHICYAWTLGNEDPTFKSTDDGEPHNSAGPPILGQIQSFELHNTLVAVVRYFGGTKLGVGGLINAYKTAAKEAILAGTLKELFLQKELLISFPYTLMSEVMRQTKVDGVRVLNQDFRDSCQLTISVRLKKYSKVLEILSNLHLVEVKEL